MNTLCQEVNKERLSESEFSELTELPELKGKEIKGMILKQHGYHRFKRCYPFFKDCLNQDFQNYQN